MTKTQLFKIVGDARDSLRRTTKSLPNRAKTKRQRQLVARHGSPRAFANAVIDAVGTISRWEAVEAIWNYMEEWNARPR